ncbi:hypothetical protein GF312_20505 [Candidatus Poribacteria bacterium]|nr:hypothetical protein [Candidatus Poribacteria bacterium]
MENVKLYIIITFIIILTGCASQNSLVDFVKEGGLESDDIVNVALASNGGRVMVSQDNPDHPASTLINGVTSSEKWSEGEGWEATYQGRFARGRYLAYGVEDPYLAEERGYDEDFDVGDPAWRGLRIQSGRGGSINTALGWAVIEFPESKRINRAVIHTIDSEEYPAEQFGVSDMLLQYWSEDVSSWLVVDRVGKEIGQTGNAIHDNKNAVVTFRFQPVNTPKLRLVIRWTNDSETYRRGYYNHSTGTIRLLEVEVYGYERKDPEEIPTAMMDQDANEVAEIEIIIDNYVDGYNRKNADVVMASISKNYMKDNETYDDFRKRIETNFEKYQQIELELSNMKTVLSGQKATVTSDYSARYTGAMDESRDIKTSGMLVFKLSKDTGFWKITQIVSQ